MALLLEKELDGSSRIGIWQIEEPEGFFLGQLHLLPVEQAELSQIKGRRRLEWLAGRYLVHFMLLKAGQAGLEERIPVLKDEFGKPHLEGSAFHLSFSHSHERVAVLLARCSGGIDIQYFVPKIGAIAHKFMREAEAESLSSATRLEHLHLYWGAKEALYKAYGRKELDFRQHILVEPFQYAGPTVQSTGAVVKGGFSQQYDLWFERLQDYFLVTCLESPPSLRRT